METEMFATLYLSSQSQLIRDSQLLLPLPLEN